MSYKDPDRYEAYYAEKIWLMLPTVYRTEDSIGENRTGPLRELCRRIGIQAAILRRSIDRLWENQSIETCDDWVIAYIGDLLATRIIPGLPSRGQRLDVAKTIRYRRRKGTVGVLEEISHDITGWDARVVEMYQRVGRTWHALDPEFGLYAEANGILGRRTGTPMGGIADLRDSYGASRANYTPFDETSHMADVRRGEGRTGWHHLMRLGVFLWRLKSVFIEGVDPVPYADENNRMTFDPTGRELPLFAKSVRAYGDDWQSPDEHALPGPITHSLLESAWNKLYAMTDTDLPDLVHAHSLGILQDEGILPAKSLNIEPERGRFQLKLPAGDEILVAYCHGCVSAIGAGAYDRRMEGKGPPSGQEGIVIRSAGAFQVPSQGTVEIDTSRTYNGVNDIQVKGGESLVIKAGIRRRPLLRFRCEASHANNPPPWTITGQEQGNGSSQQKRASLWLDGIFVSGGIVVLSGFFDTVTLSACTLDPGQYNESGVPEMSADGRPLIASELRILGHVDQLIVDRCITGPIVVAEGGSIDRLTISDSIVQSSGLNHALDTAMGTVNLVRTTVLGTGNLHRLIARSSILYGVFDVADHQFGSLQFCAFADPAAANTPAPSLPRRYASIKLSPSEPLFASLSFGQPGYGQLLDVAPAQVVMGAEDGSEMGAFCREKMPIKEQALRRKLREYMPAGLVPVLIHVT